MDRIDIIRKVRQQLAGMTPKKMEEKVMENPCWSGYEPYGTKIVDGKEVPNCVPVKMKKVKEGFPIPSPSSESEQEYISRCNSELYDEYPDDAQRNAICYKSWREK